MKKLWGLYVKIAQQLDECSQEGAVFGWMTKIKALLWAKDLEIGNISSRYRLIICLPLMWKLMPGSFAGGQYRYLAKSRLIQREEKYCPKIGTWMKYQLLINNLIISLQPQQVMVLLRQSKSYYITLPDDENRGNVWSSMEYANTWNTGELDRQQGNRMERDWQKRNQVLWEVKFKIGIF